MTGVTVCRGPFFWPFSWLFYGLIGMNQRKGTAMEYRRGAYSIDADKGHLDIDVIHQYLSEESYWAKGRTRQEVETTIEHSFCFGVYHEESGSNDQGLKLVGYARLIHDGLTVAYVADVFVLPAHRGQGLGKWLVETIVAYPAVAHIRRWMLFTASAQGLYSQYGFAELEEPKNFMLRLNQTQL
jgi:GNAT superfamily N-acetyltransferase